MWREAQFLLEFMFRLESIMAGALWVAAALFVVIPAVWMHDRATRKAIMRLNASTPIRKNYGVGHAE